MEIDRRKVIYVSLTNGAGGAEQILLMAARVTNSQIIFLKEDTKYSLSLGGTTVKATYLNRKSLFNGFVLLLKALFPFRSGYIIISSHPYLNAYLGILKRVGYLRSLLVTRESTSVFLRFKGLKRWTYRISYWLGYPSIDLLICQTTEMKTQLVDSFSFLTNKKVIVLENPIDVATVMNRADEDINDAIFEQPFICSAGRLIPLKGFDVLIKAFSLLSNEFPQHKLLILGDGAEKSKLQQLAADLGLGERIVLRGFVSNPFVYFKKAETCVVSSIREGFPNVLLQMMALNGKVVSTRCAGGIGDFNSVELVDVNNASHLAIAINRQLSKETGSENRNMIYLEQRAPKNFVNSVLSSIA